MKVACTVLSGEKAEITSKPYLSQCFPRLYRKEELEFELNGQTVTGMAYVMNSGSIMPPASHYYACILKGYQTNGMDISYLEQALKNSFETQTADICEEPEELDELQMALE